MIGELFTRVEKRYPRGAVITAELAQPAGEFNITVLFGPSGCGKTTVLRCLAGLERPETGVIRFNGETWFDSQRRIFRSPQQRDIGYLLQEYALFPHLTIGQNVGYGLRKLPREQCRNTVAAMLERFQLTGLADRFPHQISGGQQQRVALARVLVRRPRLLLLDEPLSALDATLRDELRGRLRRLLAEFGVPVVLVTHDRSEAIALGDQIVVMDAGMVRQRGSIRDVFTRPRDLDVVRIVGIETVERGEIVEVRDGLATIRIAGVKLLALAPAEPCRHVHVCIRGEDVILQRHKVGDVSVRNQLPAVVKWLTPEGPLVRVGLDCSFKLTALVTRPACEELQIQVGQQLTAAVKAPSIHLLPILTDKDGRRETGEENFSFLVEKQQLH